MTTSASRRVQAFEAAMAEANQYLASGEAGRAFAALERAHVLGQRDVMPHLRVHLQMLRVGWAEADGREVAGQLMRLALVLLGHLLGRLPKGNTGGANVSAFKPMAVAAELEELMEERDR